LVPGCDRQTGGWTDRITMASWRYAIRAVAHKNIPYTRLHLPLYLAVLTTQRVNTSLFRPHYDSLTI